MKISENTKDLADLLWDRARKEASFYPVDRPFLEPYLEKIKAVAPVAFISYNLRTYPTLYVNQLLVCLPELWEELSKEDIVFLIGSLRTEQSFFSLILFTYKYIQIDILQLVFEHPKISIPTKQKIRDFLKSQFYQLILLDDEREDFVPDQIGIDLRDWSYVRQKLLTQEGIKPATQNLLELRLEVANL